MEVPLQSDNDAALGILRDAEAFEAQVQKAVQDAHAQWRAVSEEIRQALAAAPAAPARGF